MPVPKKPRRFLGVRFPFLIKAILEELPRSEADLDRLVGALRDKIWGADLTADQKSALLFGQEPWDALPMAVMSARYLPLPKDLLPETQEDLHTLCSRLLCREGDHDLQSLFVAGWGDKAGYHQDFENFVRDLFELRDVAPTFYQATVSGDHGHALKLIIEGLPKSTTDAHALRLLTRMALIWAAFDCQATTARVRRSMRKPLGWLLAGEAKQVTAGALVAVFRPLERVHRKLLAHYRSRGDVSPDSRTGGRLAKAKTRIRHDAVMTARAKALTHAEQIERGEGDFAMDDVVDGLTLSENPFTTQLRQERTDEAFGRMRMSELWWHGLTPIQIVGFVAMRLTQLEQQLEHRLRTALTDGRLSTGATNFVMPDFDETRMRWGWKARCLTVAAALREAILHDPDLYSKSEARTIDDRSHATNDDGFTNKVLKFLENAGRHGSSATRNVPDDRERSVVNLDLAVNWRFGHRGRV